MQERAPYIGKAGEHLVLAELLLRQFDAALVEVDAGTDILAERDGRLIRVQVKTRTVGKDDASSFVLSESGVANSGRFPDYLIVVLIDQEKKIEILVFDKADVYSFIKRGLFVHSEKQKWYRAQVIRRKGSWFLKNLQHNITIHQGNFDSIR